MNSQENVSNENNPIVDQEKAGTPEQETESGTGVNSNEIDQLKSKNNELNDKYLRLYSEFDNFRKRTMKERVELSKTASAEVIASLLPVLDDLERCLASTKESDEGNLKTGISLIQSKLLNTLKQKGLEEIEVLGKVFDPELSEAITHVPVEDPSKKNTVIDVIEKGYYLNGKVIRFAKVVTGS